MIKWYNTSLPRTIWEFDSPYPHSIVSKATLLSKSVALCYKRSSPVPITSFACPVPIAKLCGTGVVLGRTV